MTELLQIEPDAQWEAVRRQLAQLRAKRVALVLPNAWHELASTARMRLLQRQAQIQHCELSIVTHDAATHTAARQVGVPVFAHPEAAMRGRWQMQPLFPHINLRKPENSLPEPPPWRRTDVVKRIARPQLHQARQRRIAHEARYRRPAPNWLRFIGIGVAGLSLVVPLLLFVRYVLPAATITLTPGRQPITTTVQLTANPNLDVPDLERNQLPARLIESSIEVTGTLATTGSLQKASAKAQGTVVFSNLGSVAVKIPAGTVVSTGTGTSVNFRTTAPADLSGGVGARVSVPIEALDPGIQGNVRANTISNVEGAMRFRVRVSNPDATYGGDAKLVPIVTQTDRDTLLARLQGDADGRAYNALSTDVQPGEWLPAESVQNFVMGQAFSAFNDEQSDELSLTLRTQAQGVVIDEGVTRQALLAALHKASPTGSKLVASSLKLQRAPGVTLEGSAVQFTITVSADYVPAIDIAAVRKAVAGLTPEAAIQQIQQHWSIEHPPEIYQDPNWFGTLPFFGRRIQVRVDYGDNAQ